ncbi:MAG: acyl-[acyl-carrier-protein]--UDP-N-acetylglucosamine O-acyltransferase [Ferrovum sp. 34-44-207]|nr:MAG: acyl-[acyl-carrier-protein]--UDP-N-acetylglucosamine O-acyltransferase [Ferrovum sp. 34-44-207]
MIHPTAIIHPNAQLDEGVKVGAYSIIDEQVIIGRDTVIGDHVKISGKTIIGQRNKIYSFALEIGHDNVIREFCTFNIGTIDDGGVTRLGNHNWIMAYVHLAHDCQVGNHTTFANNASLAGHVHVDDWAILAGFSGVHQFCRVGAHSFIGISAVVTQDVPPFVTVAGNPTSPHGVNSEGMKRRGFSAEEIMAVKRAYKKLYRSSLSLEDAKIAIKELVAEYPKMESFLDFLLQPSSRGIMR